MKLPCNKNYLNNKELELIPKSLSLYTSQTRDQRYTPEYITVITAYRRFFFFFASSSQASVTTSN